MYRIFVAAILCIGIIGLFSFTDGKKKNISGQVLYLRVHDTIVQCLRNTEQKELFFYFTAGLQPQDSFTVIGAECKYGKYAVIVHDKYSKGHSSFFTKRIRKWQDDRIDIVTRERLAECCKVKADTDISLLEYFKGFWVVVKKYRGEYYLHNNWATLIARELTDSTWTNISMEIYPELLLGLKGDREHFRLETDRSGTEVTLIDKGREIYRFSSSRSGNVYMIPARRIHDLEIIEYIGRNGDLIVPFVEFDKDNNDGLKFE